MIRREPKLDLNPVVREADSVIFSGDRLSPEDTGRLVGCAGICFQEGNYVEVKRMANNVLHKGSGPAQEMIGALLIEIAADSNSEKIFVERLLDSAAGPANKNRAGREIAADVRRALVSSPHGVRSVRSVQLAAE